MRSAAAGAFDCWAENYDQTLNPLVALAERTIAALTGDVQGLRVLDAGCGTGRRLKSLADLGVRAVGLDLSLAMISKAPRGAAAVADLDALPVRPGTCDLVVSSLALSYALDPAAAMRVLQEAVRPGGTLVVADLHPQAAAAGWRRTFRSADGLHEVVGRTGEFAAAIEQGPGNGWRIEASASVRFEQPDFARFVEAGRPELFEAAAAVPALLVAAWRREQGG